jgi:hypothetical protein
MQQVAQHDHSAAAVTYGLFRRELTEAYNNVVR